MTAVVAAMEGGRTTCTARTTATATVTTASSVVRKTKITHFEQDGIRSGRSLNAVLCELGLDLEPSLDIDVEPDLDLAPDLAPDLDPDLIP